MYSFSTEKINSTLKVETHNHPTAISPFFQELQLVLGEKLETKVLQVLVQSLKWVWLALMFPI